MKTPLLTTLCAFFSLLLFLVFGFAQVNAANSDIANDLKLPLKTKFQANVDEVLSDGIIGRFGQEYFFISCKPEKWACGEPFSITFDAQLAEKQVVRAGGERVSLREGKPAPGKLIQKEKIGYALAIKQRSVMDISGDYVIVSRADGVASSMLLAIKKDTIKNHDKLWVGDKVPNMRIERLKGCYHYTDAGGKVYKLPIWNAPHGKKASPLFRN